MGVYAVFAQQPRALTGVLGRDQVHRAQDVQGAPADIRQVADGGGHHIEYAALV